MGFGKERGEFVGNADADLIDIAQIGIVFAHQFRLFHFVGIVCPFGGGLRHGVVPGANVAVLACKQAGGCLSDLPDAEPVNEAIKGNRASGIDCGV